MQIKEYLEKVCHEIRYKPIREEIYEELKNHLEETKEAYIEQGVDKNISEEKAIKQMGDYKEIGKKLNKIHRPKLDWKLLLIILVLLCFGCLVCFIRAQSIDSKIFGIEGQSIMNFIKFLIIGTVISIAIYFVDYRKIKKYSNILYIIATLVILYSLWNGVSVNGSLHLHFGRMKCSPSVIAMPLYIISFVGFIVDLNKKNSLEIKFLNNININLIKIIILSVLSIFAFSFIPAMTSGFILGLIYLIIATIKILENKENKVKNLFELWGIVFVIGMLLLICNGGVAPFRINRFMTAFNPERDPSGGGWLGVNRKNIIETAKGLGEAENISNAIDLFDEGTNYAFISILAHYGWIASIGIVIAVLGLSIKLIVNAVKMKDNYGKLLIVGISSMFILQSTFNILMNLNLWIEADFNIPFVSYGGANLIINLMSLAIVLSVYKRKNLVFSKTENQIV